LLSYYLISVDIELSFCYHTYQLKIIHDRGVPDKSRYGEVLEKLIIHTKRGRHRRVNCLYNSCLVPGLTALWLSPKFGGVLSYLYSEHLHAIFSGNRQLAFYANCLILLKTIRIILFYWIPVMQS